MNSLKQIGLAIHGYHDVNKHGPVGTLSLSAGVPPTERLSWLVVLLPFVEQDPLFQGIDRDQGWLAPENEHASLAVVPVYFCPSQDAAAGKPVGSSYVGMAGLGPDAATLPLDDPRAGFFGYDRVVSFKDVRDGLSSTILVIESKSAHGPWTAGGPGTVRGYDPAAVPAESMNRPFGVKHRDDNFFRTHPLVTQAAMGDGSGRSFGVSSLTPASFQALVTIAGRDSPGAD
jgi:hypothetical protein